MCAKTINKSKRIISYLLGERKRDGPWRPAAELQRMQWSNVLEAVGKLV